MKIILHGFGAFPFVHYHMIQKAKSLFPFLEWSIVLGNSIPLQLFQEKLPEVPLLDVEKAWTEKLARVSNANEIDLSSYNGNIYSDIAAEKRNFKHRSGEEQLRRAASLYFVVKNFFMKIQPDYAMISQIEGVDGKIFAAVARELGVRLIVPCSCRNLGGIFFAEADAEVVPSYAEVNAASLSEAETFLHQFRKSPTPANSPIHFPGEPLPDFQKPFLSRAWRGIKRGLRHPELLEPDTFRVALLNNLPLLRDAIWGVRARINRLSTHVEFQADLPKSFVYYPLQYSPESSINTPAPYFVDQLRVLDAIRFSLPGNIRLVVKEHPACLGLRPVPFYRQLRKLPGVVIASVNMKSSFLIQHALLTISVTGTSILEAFLFGKSAIALGSNLIAHSLGGITTLSALPLTIQQRLGQEIPDETIITGLAKIFSVRHCCNFSSPGTVGEPILRDENIERLLHAIHQHIEKTSKNGSREAHEFIC